MRVGRHFPGIVLAAWSLVSASCGGGSPDLPSSPTPSTPAPVAALPSVAADPEDESPVPDPVPSPVPSPPVPPPIPTPIGDPPVSGQTAVLMGAGDMGDCGLPGTALTARLLSGSIFTLGDHAYPNGNPEDFRDCYDPHWGRFRAATRPTRATTITTNAVLGLEGRTTSISGPMRAMGAGIIRTTLAPGTSSP